MKVSILIPIYNEFLTLPLVIQRVLEAKLPPGYEKEIIIIDDGSTDGTTQFLIEICQQNSPMQLHRSPVNSGKGTAIRIGLAKASGDIVIVQDGDLEYDPADYLKILEPIAAGTADVVYGSRFRNARTGMKTANWIANKILTGTANVLYNAHLTDQATAYKAFRMDVIGSLHLQCRRFEFCPEVTAKLLRTGFKIHEVPISYNPRGILEGKKIRWHDGVQALWTLLRHRITPRDRCYCDRTLPKANHS